MVDLERLSANPRQPREAFDTSALESLADSIRRVGILQPIVVRRKGSDFEIIAGERRWRAARLAGLREIPVTVREEPNDGAMLELALLENVQREDLNAIEKALGFQRLSREFGRNTEEIAKSIGLDRTTVANFIRLLELPGEMRQAIQNREITAGHGRALLAITDPKLRSELFKRIVREKLSVRDLELVTSAGAAGKSKARKARKSAGAIPWVSELEERWSLRLGSRVRVRAQGGRAVVTIHCGSLDELDRITDLAIGFRRDRSAGEQSTSSAT